MQPIKKRTILLIDEDPDILKLMGCVFATEDLELVTAPSPEAGLTLLEKASVDCVLIDIHFAHAPECFGFLQAARALPCTADVPILATSAMHEQEVVTRVLALGARKFIAKPFYPGEILKEVRTLFS